MEAIDREAIILRNRCYINTAKPDVPEQGVQLGISSRGVGEGFVMGYKGPALMDTGYFYAPYLPLTNSPVVIDPKHFDAQKGILTRYGQKLLSEGERFYGRINLANFEEEKMQEANQQIRLAGIEPESFPWLRRLKRATWDKAVDAVSFVYLFCLIWATVAAVKLGIIRNPKTGR